MFAQASKKTQRAQRDNFKLPRNIFQDKMLCETTSFTLLPGSWHYFHFTSGFMTLFSFFWLNF